MSWQDTLRLVREWARAHLVQMGRVRDILQTSIHELEIEANRIEPPKAPGVSESETTVRVSRDHWRLRAEPKDLQPRKIEYEE